MRLSSLLLLVANRKGLKITHSGHSSSLSTSFFMVSLTASLKHLFLPLVFNSTHSLTSVMPFSFRCSKTVADVIDSSRRPKNSQYNLAADFSLFVLSPFPVFERVVGIFWQLVGFFWAGLSVEILSQVR